MKQRVRAITTTVLSVAFLAASGPVESSPGKMKYVKWHDPNENAFSTEVPEGWVTEGGVFRFAAVDVRTEFKTSSPDGSIRISSGDKSLPTFIVPNSMLEMSGFREGFWYSPGYNVSNLVMRYKPPGVFLREYLNTMLAATCSGLEFTSERERPDISSQINSIHARYGLPVNLDAAEVEFSCTEKNRAMKGYYFAGTRKASMYGMENWTVPYLVGYVAIAEKAQLAAEVTAHISKSTTVNPDWLRAAQANIDQQVNIVNSTNDAISRMILETDAARQKSMDRLYRRGSDARRGVEYMTDPVTGERHPVESGANYHWINDAGDIVSTMKDEPPGRFYRKMLPVEE